MNKSYSGRKPVPYVFVVVEQSPPHDVFERMDDDANYMRVWRTFVEKYKGKSAKLMAYSWRGNGTEGMRFFKEIESPSDMENL